MALTHKLELRQRQGPVMTPQLRQAIRLLQMSNLELGAYVERELDRNPLLQRAGPDSDGREISASDIAAGSSFWSAGSGGQAGDFGTRLSERRTLHDHLTDQLQLAVRDPVRRMIGAHLIDLVDEAGYLSGTVAEVADQLGADQKDVEATLMVLQGFEPTGVFARDLAECLSLQLAECNRLGPAMRALLSRLDLLARHDIGALARLCGVGTNEVAAMIAEIRQLDPKPGLRFGEEPVQAVIPDVFVRPRRGGAWHVELNAETLPRVLVNERYHAEVSAKVGSREVGLYVAECLASANWLVRSLARRAATLLKVSGGIVRLQDAFLRHGVQFLRPLNLRTVADAVSMHESTVSRVTSNKYIATPRGVFELKYFFTGAIAGAGGKTAHSAEAVRSRIGTLIGTEERAGILTDGSIAALLKEEGVNIARRTVAKYRATLGIPSSAERRRRAAP